MPLLGGTSWHLVSRDREQCPTQSASSTPMGNTNLVKCGDLRGCRISMVGRPRDKFGKRSGDMSGALYPDRGKSLPSIRACCSSLELGSGRTLSPQVNCTFPYLHEPYLLLLCSLFSQLHSFRSSQLKWNFLREASFAPPGLGLAVILTKQASCTFVSLRLFPFPSVYVYDNLRCFADYRINYYNRL